AEAGLEVAYDALEIGDPDDLVSGDVADVGDAEERQRVMLAERGEGDRALDDLAGRRVDDVPALGRERGHELRVALVACGRVEEGAQETLGRLPRSGRVEIHAERGEDLADVAAEAAPLAGIYLPRLCTVEATG